MSKLKLEIDRPTLGCLVNGMQELAAINLRNASDDEINYETACTYNLLREFFISLREKSRSDDLFFRSKIELPLALALRLLVLNTHPLDAWSNAELIRIADELDRYIITSLRALAPAGQSSGALGDGNNMLKLN